MTTILRGEQAPQFELPGVTFRAAAAPSRGSNDVCMWRLTVAPGHVSDAGHRLDRDEIFMILSGELVLSAGGPVLRAGDVAVVPAGELIATRNPGAEPAQVAVAVPAGFTATMEDGTTIGTPPWAL